jgi:hypothetical protein
MTHTHTHKHTHAHTHTHMHTHTHTYTYTYTHTHTHTRHTYAHFYKVFALCLMIGGAVGWWASDKEFIEMATSWGGKKVTERVKETRRK